MAFIYFKNFYNPGKKLMLPQKIQIFFSNTHMNDEVIIQGIKYIFCLMGLKNWKF